MSLLNVGTIQAKGRDLILEATDVYRVKVKSGDHETGLLTRKNLFINPEGLVNQEGYVDGTVTTEAQHIFDMWAVDRVGTGECLKVTRVPKGFTLDNDVVAPDTAWMRQQNDDIDSVADGDVITVSGNVTDISGGNFRLQGYGCDESVSTAGEYSFPFVKDSSDTGDADTPYFKFVVDAGEVVTFIEPKLEESGVQSVYETPGVTENELNCYRYLFYIAGGGTYSPKYIGIPYNNYTNITVSTLVSMATVHTVTAFVVTALELDASSQRNITVNGVDSTGVESVVVSLNDPAKVNPVFVSCADLKLDARPIL